MAKTAILYDFQFYCSGTGCLTAVEDAEAEGCSRRAVGGCAEVCDHDVHVEHVYLSLFVQFDENPPNRLGATDVFVGFYRENCKAHRLTFENLVVNGVAFSDRPETRQKVAKPRDELPKKFLADLDEAFGSCERICASVETS